MNILLTGSNGFVGSYIFNVLSKSHNVSTISWQDISSELLFSNIDIIIHCAAISVSETNMNDTELEELYSSNVELTKALAESAVNSGVKKFIYISTIKVFGEGNNSSSYSINSNVNPVSYYGKSKLEAELSLKSISLNSKNMSFVILRPPLIYGPNVKGNFRALLNLISKSLPIPCAALTKNSRSLLYIGNLTDLISRCLEHPKAVNQVLLVSDDEHLSTYDMLNLMVKVQNSKTLIFYFPIWILKWVARLTGKTDIFLRLTDSLEVDISYTKELLNWKPPYSPKQGFAKTCEHINGIE